MSVAIISILILSVVIGRRGIGDTKSSSRDLHYITEDYYERQIGNLIGLVSYLRKIMCPGYGPHFVLVQLADAIH